MSTELAKAFESAPTQQQADQLWNSANAFHAEPTDPGDPYSIVIPPPNVTAALHLGHALNNTLQDILVRWHRMLGDNTCWLPGTDHAGIATQTVVDKRLQAEGQPALKDYKVMESRGESGRERFIAKVQAWKDEYEARITGQLKAMGCSCDWDRQAFTMDDPRARAVREAFFQLFKDGLIYRGKRLVNWDPATQTALADDEVEMEEVDGQFYYLRYPLVEEGEDKGTRGQGDKETGNSSGLKYITVATTRPETMLGDTAVAVNPKDPRAAGLRGKKVRLPIVDRIIPIIEDDYVVLPDPKSDDPKAQFATGFLKVTPAHDPNDYDLGRRHNLPMINVLAPDGTISDQHGWTDVGGADFTLGLDRYEAREAIVEWFRQNKLLEDVKPYRHSVGHSYRSHVAIEPYLSDQWYVKVTDPKLAGAALRAMVRDQVEQSSPSPAGAGGATRERASSPVGEGRGEGKSGSWEGQLRFYPARYAKTFQAWHENIRDWCISRQLWWGHRIPVWHTVFTPSFSSQAASNDPAALRREQLMHFAQCIDTLTAYLVDQGISRDDIVVIDSRGPIRGQEGHFVVSRDPRADVLLARIALQNAEGRSTPELPCVSSVAQDPDVLDTWFSSALWPLSTLGWPDPSAIRNPQSAINVWNPTDVLCTAREIITLWVSRMVMFNLYFLERLPFADVFVHAMIQDGEGRKMSKSLGNGVDPLDIIDSHGADALRFTLAHMATNTQDVRMPVARDPATGKNTSPKFDEARNFCNKIWNAARFVIGMLEKEGTEARRREGTEGEAKDEQSAIRNPQSAMLSLSDRWILSRFTRTLADAEDALRNYRFDQYAKAAYDFFWGDFCDWYIEAAKPALRDRARAPQTAEVIATVLDASLRLLHPAMPFITEVLFQKLGETRPGRGLPGMLELDDPARKPARAALLMTAPWPRARFTDPQAETTFARLQQVVAAIRNLRNEYKKKTATVSILAPAEHAAAFSENRELLEVLAGCQLKAAGPDVAAPAHSVRASAGEVEIFVEGLTEAAGGLDPTKEQVLRKQLADLQKEEKTLEGRLANPSYATKAPPHLVQQTRDRLEQVRAETAKIKQQLGE